MLTTPETNFHKNSIIRVRTFFHIPFHLNKAKETLTLRLVQEFFVFCLLIIAKFC